MRGVGRVHPDLDAVRIREKRPVQPGGFLFRIQPVETLLPFLVFFSVLGPCIAFTQNPGTVHGRSLPVRGRAAGKGEPGLVPQEDHVRLDGQDLLHVAPHIVDQPVEGAVGQKHHLGFVQTSGLFQC